VTTSARRPLVLIVEDDAKFARRCSMVARESGFKGVVALDGGTALVLVKEHSPDAITLDLKLPDMDGWAVLDLLKHDPKTRHIPVSVISVANGCTNAFTWEPWGRCEKPAVKERSRGPREDAQDNRTRDQKRCRRR